MGWKEGNCGEEGEGEVMGGKRKVVRKEEEGK